MGEEVQRMNTTPGKHSRRSALVIVAHPDDETIWSGGLILRNPDWDWTIMSLSRANDPDRHPKYRRVCEHLKARAIIADLDDSPQPKQIDPREEIGSRIRREVCDCEWDLCITHGANGEYGHQRHRETHTEVLRLFGDGILRCDELWTFAYVCNAQGGRCAAGGDANVRLPLTGEQLAEKKRIVHEMYGYRGESFEVRACVSPEGFKRHCPAR